MDVIERIVAKAENGAVKTSRREVESIFSALLKTGDFWEIVDSAQVTVWAASAVVRCLLEEGLVSFDGEKRLVLTAHGQRVVMDMGIEPRPDYRCDKCGGRGVFYGADMRFYREFLECSKGRPDPLKNYDQGIVTPESTVARVLFMDTKGDLQNKDILVLGAEDDLTGLAIALTRKARSVLILDIDERLIEFDLSIFQRLEIRNAHAMVWDVRRPLPSEMLGRYDVFVSDPPETKVAFKAFIGRGIAALKQSGGAGYFGLTLTESNLYRWQEIQKTLIGDFGLVITDVIQGFNAYMNWDYLLETPLGAQAPMEVQPKGIWYRSAWYRVEALSGFRGWNDEVDDQAFYYETYAQSEEK